MLEGRHLPIPPLWLVLVLYGGCAALGAALTRLDWPVWLGLSLVLVALGAFWMLGFWWYRQGGALLPLGGPSLAFLITAGWFHAHFSRQERRQKRFIKNAFGRYLHPDWVEQLMANPDLLRLQGERRELTVLFTDVADFTTISEALPPTSLVHVLSQYLDGMTQVIMAHGGAVNKYMGDGIMVLFGAPALTGMAQWWDILLVIVGMALLAAELFLIPGFGVAGVAGIVCLALGFVGTFIAPDPSGSILPTSELARQALVRGLSTLLLGFFAGGVAMWLGVKNFARVPGLNRLVLSAQLPRADDPDSLLGAMSTPQNGPAKGSCGVVVSTLRPIGRARFGATIYDVVSERGIIEEGRPVRVVASSGFKTVVEDVDEPV